MATLSLGVAALIIFGFIPGMGIPGALVLALGDFLLAPLGSSVAYAGLPPGDTLWPACIALTFLWPPMIVASHIIAFRWLAAKPAWMRWVVFLLILIVWALVLTWIVALQSQSL